MYCYYTGSGTHDREPKGANYIRWGKKTCARNATLVYEGDTDLSLSY